MLRRRDRLGALLGKALDLGRSAGPAGRLAALDRRTLRAWIEVQPAVKASLGAEVEAAFTRLVIQAAEADVQVGRLMAEAVPDHLARVPPDTRLRYLALVAEVLRERPAAASVVVRTLPELLASLPVSQAEDFLRQGLALHGDASRVAESFLRRESDLGQRAHAALQAGLTLEAVRRTLALYARAHCGQDVDIRPSAASAAAFSDGRHVYLPERVDLGDEELEFLVYRVSTARAAGYLEFGTFDLDLRKVPGSWPEPVGSEGDIERLVRAFPDRHLARSLYQVAEDARVEAHLVREYPGIGRDLARLRPVELARRARPGQEVPPHRLLVEALRTLAAGGLAPAGLPAELGLALDEAWALVSPLARGDVPPEAVAAALPRLYAVAGRLVASPAAPQAEGPGGPEPEDLPEDLPLGGTSIRPEALDEAERRADAEARDAREVLEQAGLSASLSEIRRMMQGRSRPGEVDEQALALLEEELHLTGAQVDPEGEEGSAAPGERPPPSVVEDPDASADAREVRLPEWDHVLGDYKPRWVRLFEHRLAPAEASATWTVEAVLREHAPEIAALRRRFEALRPQAWRREPGQVDGDYLDLDRVVEARVTRKAGGSPPERLYGRHVRDRRDVAVAFLVDMSSSTNEVAGEEGKRVIEVEKEALVVMAEALDAIGDAFAIYGFSGYGRANVAFYVAKDFGDAYGATTRQRIARMRWKMENRDGAAIRHATRRLLDQPARVRLLVLLSDGKPLDCGCDHYYDRYAQEDTRVALREARADGVHPFCITVDPRGSTYLDRMYGDVGYTVIERVSKLPERLPGIYRRLTR